MDSMWVPKIIISQVWVTTGSVDVASVNDYTDSLRTVSRCEWIRRRERRVWRKTKEWQLPCVCTAEHKLKKPRPLSLSLSLTLPLPQALSLSLSHTQAEFEAEKETTSALYCKTSKLQREETGTHRGLAAQRGSRLWTESKLNKMIFKKM